MVVPSTGTVLLTWGNVSVTIFWNTVNDNRTVIPANNERVNECNFVLFLPPPSMTSQVGKFLTLAKKTFVLPGESKLSFEAVNI